MNPKTIYPIAAAFIVATFLFPTVIGFTVAPTNPNPSVDPGEYIMIGGYFTPTFSGSNDYTVVLVEGTGDLDGLTDPDIVNRMPSRRMQPGETLTFNFNMQMGNTPGDYYYKVIVWCSQWGTEESSAVITVHVNGQVDTTKPLVYVDSHKDGDEVSTSSITLTGTASDTSGIDKIVILRRGTLKTWTGTISGGKWSATIPLIEDTNSITVEAHDKFQNIGSVFLNIHYTKPVVPPVDTTAPTITVQSPADGYTVGTPDITLSGITYDEIGTTEVTAKVGAGTAKTATGTDIWSIPLTLEEKQNIITVTATDAAGNTETTIHTITYSTAADPTDTGTVITPPEPDLITDLFLENTLNINDGEQITLSGTLAHTSTTSVDYDVSVYDQDTGEVFARTTSIVRVPSGDITSFEMPQFALSPGAHTLIIKADTTITALATTRTITVAADGKITDPQIPDLTDKPTQASADTTETEYAIYYIGTFAIVWFISWKIIEYTEAS